MPAQFPLSAVLGLRDNLTRPAQQAFARVKDAGVRAGKRVGKSFSGKRIAAGLGRGLDTAGGLLGLGSVAGIVAAGAKVVDFEKSLQALGTQAGFTGSKLDDTRKDIDRVSLQTGVAREDVLAMANTIVNLEGAAGFSAEKMELLARASVAANAPAEDLAQVMFALNKSFFDGSASAETLERSLSAVIQAGKEGSIPLSEMSTVLQQVSAQFAETGVRGVTASADIAAALQVARARGFGSAAEAGTGLKAMITAFKSSDKRVRKLTRGQVKLFAKTKDGNVRMRRLRDILDDIGRSKLARDPRLLQEALGSSEAVAFVSALLKGRDAFDELSAAARESNAVQEDFNKNINSQSGRLSKAMNELQNSIAQAFTPEVLEAFAVVLGNIAKTAGFVVEKIAAAAKLADETAQALAERQVQRQAATPQLLLEQTTAFGRGAVSASQARGLAQRGFAESQFTAAAAQQIVREASGRGLVRGDEIDKEALRALDISRDERIRIFQGLQRALEVSRQSPQELVPAAREREVERAFANPEVAVPGGPQFPPVVQADMGTRVTRIWEGMLEEMRRQREATERLERAQVDRGRR